MSPKTDTPRDPKSEMPRSKWLSRKIYTNPAEKKRDFWAGVGLWFVLNIVLLLSIFPLNAFLYTILSYDAADLVALIVGLVPLLVNIGLIVYFAFTRSQIALGMVAGFGSALLIVICLGLFLTAVCFSG